MDLQLRGKTALITGASKGIGAATAAGLAREGCDVVLVARGLDDLERQAGVIRAAADVEVTVLAADLSRPDEATRVAAACPWIDILVNNAGAIPGGTLAEIDDAAWRAAWDLKVFGYINLCRAFYPGMTARGGGVMINVIGAGANAKSAGYICGAVGNAALETFTQTLGRASPKDGIRVVGVHPGPVATDRLKSLARQTKGGLDFSAMAFGRPAEPQEIGAAVAFLASPLSAYISGTIISIDGGATAT